jgi:hypothetical protein
VSAIARLAEEGKSPPSFTNKGRIIEPIQRVNVDFSSPMLEELDNAAKELNSSRGAVIKTLIRQALDQHYLATSTTMLSRQWKRPADILFFVVAIFYSC